MLVEIDDIDKALEHRFLGSPTVRINGEDIDPAARTRTAFGLMCRTYLGADGLSVGVPSVEMLEPSTIISLRAMVLHCGIKLAAARRIEATVTGVVRAPK
jgi:hypothetical protein